MVCAGCRGDRGVSRPCQGPWFHGLVKAAGGKPGHTSSQVGVIALYVYSDKATKRCAVALGAPAAASFVTMCVCCVCVLCSCVRHARFLGLSSGNSGRSKHGLYVSVANAHKVRKPITLGFIDAPDIPQGACLADARARARVCA